MFATLFVNNVPTVRHSLLLFAETSSATILVQQIPDRSTCLDCLLMVEIQSLRNRFSEELGNVSISDKVHDECLCLSLMNNARNSR